MPFDYGLRLDNRQRIANARAKPIKANKNQSVDGAEGLSLRSGSSQNVYLLPQHPNFCLKRRPRPDQIDDHPNNEPDKISHHATASPDSRSTASQIGFATGTAVWQSDRYWFRPTLLPGLIANLQPAQHRTPSPDRASISMNQEAGASRHEIVRTLY